VKVYLDKNFSPVDEDKAVMAKVIPEDGSAPYFVAVKKEAKSIEVKDWRTDAETRLKRKLDAFFKKMNDRIAGFLSTSPAWSDIPEAFWGEVGLEMQDIVGAELYSVALNSAQRLGSQLPLTYNWELVNNRALEFINNYWYREVGYITGTSRQTVQDSLTAFYEQGLTRQELEDRLVKFGDIRAEQIAVTEVTRASAEGERAIVDELAVEGVTMVEVWMTNEDEKVCDICGDRDGKEEGDGWGREDGPPAHVNCRCWVNHYLPGYDWTQ